ncbi:MAG: LD-carboxypeptidase [Alphaproteobacteria bacterium]|nr:LD-carboxypeptidase [Alphaproteobacteria bacterium]
MKKTIGIIAPASWIKEDYLKSATNFLKDNNFNVVVAPQVSQQNGYLAGTDEEKIKYLHEFFIDDNIDIILCAKGGYGSIRLLDKIDYNLINKKKIFIGYSDISMLNIALTKYSPNIDVFFGPNLIDIAYLNCDKNHDTLKYLVKFLKQENNKKLRNEIISKNIKILKEGKCKGNISGGTLTIIMANMGTPYELDLNNKILFIEEKKEFIFKVERMLYQLKNAGKLDNIKGLIVGNFYETPQYHIPFHCSMSDMIADFFKDYNIPIILNFPAGHCDDKIALPLEKEVTINTKSKNIISW